MTNRDMLYTLTTAALMKTAQDVPGLGTRLTTNLPNQFATEFTRALPWQQPGQALAKLPTSVSNIAQSAGKSISEAPASAWNWIRGRGYQPEAPVSRNIVTQPLEAASKKIKEVAGQ